MIDPGFDEEEYRRQVEAEVWEEILRNDPFTRAIERGIVNIVEFWSQSKGRGRKRRRAELVTLINCRGRWVRFSEDEDVSKISGLDCVATEALGRNDATADELLRRLRALPSQQRLAKGK